MSNLHKPHSAQSARFCGNIF